MLFGEGILQAMNDYLFWDGGKDGAVVRALTSHHCGVVQICWLNLLFGSLPCSESFFSPVFPSTQKPTFPNSIRLGMVDEEPLCGCATSKSSLFEKMRFIWVSMYLILIEDTIFTSPPSGDGTAILRSHRATKRSIRLQDKGSTFISQ